MPPCASAVSKTLDRIKSAYGNSKKLQRILEKWVPRTRWQEIDDSLIRDLCFLDEDIALSILSQLKEARHSISRINSDSMFIKTNISTPDGHDTFELDALLDSGATGCYLSERFVTTNGLKLITLPRPIPVYNADGSLNRSGSIKHVVDVVVTIKNHTERLHFSVTNLGSSDVILGYSWLKAHNPIVDWSTSDLCFTRCPAACNSVSPTCVTTDPDHIRAIHTHNTTDDPELTWTTAIADELDDGETMLVVDIKGAEEDYLRSITVKDSIHLVNEQRCRAASEPDRYVKEFETVFAEKEFDQLPPERPWDHAIELKPDAEPITSKVYPLAKSEQAELDKFIKDHLRTGRIRPSKSPIASPFFFVKKKDGSLRPVQDYRKLNAMMIRNQYPLPLISELMDKLKGAKYFTKLDVRWGFNNIRIKKGDEYKAAFITNRGLFEPLVMFFGLMNSPATFQNMMNDLFKDLIRDGGVIIYMDGILIFTNNLATHRRLTREVLQILKDNNLYLKPEKCEFEKEEVEYLGVLVSQGSLRMSPSKVDAIASWPVPNSKRELQQFLSFLNFYRRFIRNFAHLAAPLNHLTGNVPWNWTPVEHTAFLAFRDAALDGPTLALPLDDAPLRIEADSSGYATGGVLTQRQGDHWRPVAFYSKSLSDVERNYDVHNRELLSIMRALADWRRYILGSAHPVEIHSDHSNLQYFMKSQRLNRRQARWTLELADYNFTLGYEDNANVTLLKPHLISLVETAVVTPDFLDDICGRQDEVMPKARQRLPGWSVSDGIALWHGRVYVPDFMNLRQRIMHANHDSIMIGHPG
ncbi:hypothetical protein NLJ89_g4422 [Agrocybe chaxingu]|uniref:RNA-directed DNA polymerase n=1 Tax=Agrocybe chaxingu TaxID=84603 RepID=A0A9W8MWJ5_9AGAR|nr:hypothetical protein NLJ89_g4422 [Agrocybe chaxingu]